MSLTLAELQNAIEKVGKTDPVLKIRVSEKIFSEIKEFSAHADSFSANPTFYGVSLEIDPYYRPDWWSEHYRERVVMHTGNETLEMAVSDPFVSGRKWESLDLANYVDSAEKTRTDCK